MWFCGVLIRKLENQNLAPKVTRLAPPFNSMLSASVSFEFFFLRVHVFIHNTQAICSPWVFPYNGDTHGVHNIWCTQHTIIPEARLCVGYTIYCGKYFNVRHKLGWPFCSTYRTQLLNLMHTVLPQSQVLLWVSHHHFLFSPKQWLKRLMKDIRSNPMLISYHRPTLKKCGGKNNRNNLFHLLDNISTRITNLEINI